MMLELRQLGGAYRQTGEHPFAMGKGEASYILNAGAAVLVPGAEAPIKAHFAALTRALGPAVTGETFVNFMEGEYASADRLRAAYSDEDWQRLVAVKDAYDPANVFRFNRNIAPSR